MSVKSAQSVTVMFTTTDPADGSATSATGTPAGTLYVNGTANGATVTVTNITTGIYKAAVTLPSLSAGDIVSLVVTATVSGIAGAGVIWQDVTDTKRVSDLNDVSTADVNAQCDTALTDYDPPTRAELTSDINSLNDPTAAAIADAIADELLSGHTTPGSLGQAISDILTDTGTTIPAQITALNDLSAAEVNAEVDTALGDYDGPTHAELTAALAALNDFDPTSALEGAIGYDDALRIILAYVAGKTAGGGGSPITFRDQADTKNRISMTVDTNGNRSSTTVDGT